MASVVKLCISEEEGADGDELLSLLFLLFFDLPFPMKMVCSSVSCFCLLFYCFGV